MVNLDDGLVGVVFLVCLARVVFAGGVNRPREVFAIFAFADDDENVVHLTPAVWSNRDQHVSTPAATKPFVGVVSSATTVAVWFSLYPAWGSVTRFSGLVWFRCEKQRLEVTGEYIHNMETISIVISLTVFTVGKTCGRSPPVACHDVLHRFVGGAIGVLPH